MEYKLLNEAMIDEIYNTFMEAFSDYSIDVSMPIEKFIELNIENNSKSTIKFLKKIGFHNFVNQYEMLLKI